MYCVKCGTAIPAGARFCPECGEPVKKETDKKSGEVKTIQFRCKGCGSVMDIDPDSPILHCPFCSSSELIQEDKDVTVERIRSKVKRDEQQTYKEVQAGWQQVRQKEIEENSKEAEYKREKAEIQSYHRGFMFYLTILLAVFFTFTMVMAFEDKEILPGIVAIIQVALCLVSILMGLRTIREKGRGLRTIFVVLAIVLIFPYMSLSTAADKKQKENEIKEKSFTWPTSGIALQLPQPDTNNGQITMNGNSTFSFTAYYMTQDEYQAYVQSCIDNGFSIDSEWTGDKYYSAYNDEGYYLNANYFTLDPTYMTLTVYAPKEMTEIAWPDTDMVNLLPRPESTVGSIDSNSEKYFTVYVGNTTKEQYDRYVDACMAAGFDKKYGREDESYYADHENGYHLNVDYRGFNTMKVYIEDRNK